MLRFSLFNCAPIKKILCLDSFDEKAFSRTPLLGEMQTVNAAENPPPPEATRHEDNTVDAEDIPALIEAIIAITTTKITPLEGKSVLPDPTQPFLNDGSQFKGFLLTAVTYRILTHSSVALSLLFIERLLDHLAKANLQIPNRIFERCAVVSFILAEKSLEDTPFNTKSFYLLYARAVPLKQLAADELSLLKILDWNLSQDLTAMEKHHQRVFNRPFHP
jgi:hypothetical protein